MVAEKLVLKTKLRPGLSGNPFLNWQKRWQKRLGAEDGKLAPKLKKVSKVF